MEDISKLYEVIYKIPDDALLQIFLRILVNRAEDKVLTEIIDYAEKMRFNNSLLEI